MKFTDKLNQTAVYWASPVDDGYGGKTFDTGVEISVRWEDRNIKFIDADGEENLSRAIIYANQDFDLGGYLFLGTLNDLSSAAGDDPTVEHDAYEIKQVLKSPSVKSDQYLRKVYL